MPGTPKANGFELEPLTSPFQHDPPSRPRPRRSLWRCAAYMCLVFGTLLIGGSGYFGYQAFNFGIKALSGPHPSLIYNGTIHPNLGAAVVRPLIDQDTKFDLVATVLLRYPDSITRPQQEEDIRRKNEERRTDGGMDEAEIQLLESKEQVTANYMSVNVTDLRSYAREQLLWSGYLARGRTLGDKALDTSVTFDLPLERFYDHTLLRRDLRIGIALIPQSPSMLNRLEDFSDWRGDVTEDYPKAIDAKILQALNFNNTVPMDDDEQYSLIEHMVRGHTLLEFHSLPDVCDNGLEDTASDDNDEEDLYSSIQSNTVTDKNDTAAVKNETAVYASSGLHPFVLTRSHFYIINETRPYERKAYDKKHKHLRETSCGRSMPALVPSWMLCQGDYKSNGHWETRLVLSPGEVGGKKELAYAPYMSRLTHSAGPRHVTKIPVSRAICGGVPQDRTDDPKTITVTHEIRFSTLSATRLSILETFGQSDRLGHNATEAELTTSHDLWAQNLGLWGDRQPGSQPWRRVVIFILSEIVLAIPLTILGALYWYTRQTPTGLSHTGTYLRAIGWTLSIFSFLAWSFFANDYFSGFMALLFDGWALIPCWCMLRLVWHWEWVGKWGEGLRRTRWSHRERKSMRVGASIPTMAIGLLVVTLWAANYLLQIYGIHVFQPRVVETREPHLETWYQSIFFKSFTNALLLSGHLVQLEFNRRAKTFAGDYALTTYLQLAMTSVGSLSYIDRFIGVHDTRGGMSYNDLISTGAHVWAAWQAYTLPRVEQDVKDVEDE